MMCNSKQEDYLRPSTFDHSACALTSNGSWSHSHFAMASISNININETNVELTEWSRKLLADTLEVTRPNLADMQQRTSLKKSHRTCDFEPDLLNAAFWDAWNRFASEIDAWRPLHTTVKDEWLIHGKLSVRGNLDSLDSAVETALHHVFVEVLKPAAWTNVGVEIKPCTPKAPQDTLCLRSQAWHQFSFAISLRDPNDKDAVIELLKLEEAYAGSVHFLPTLAHMLSDASHLALRIQVELPQSTALTD